MCNQFRVHTRCASFRLSAIAMWLFRIDLQFFFILEFPGCSKGVEFKPRKCPIQLNSFNFFVCKCNINNPSSKCTLVLFRSQKNPTNSGSRLHISTMYLCFKHQQFKFWQAGTNQIWSLADVYIIMSSAWHCGSLVYDGMRMHSHQKSDWCKNLSCSCRTFSICPTRCLKSHANAILGWKVPLNFQMSDS